MMQPYRTSTRVLDALSDQSDDAIQQAAAVIQRGGLVAFPTETVYGLGADGLSEAAVARIFAAKERPANDPVILHVASLGAVARIAQNVPSAAYTLAGAFWPGPLTLVLRRQPQVPANVSAGRDTVAVRMPDHPIALALIRAAGTPIAAPSANRFSRPSPTSAQHVLSDLDGRVDIVLDGGPTQVGVESTIVDLTGQRPAVLRPGGLPLEKLREHLPDLAFTPQHFAESAESVPAPGTLLKHYSPDAELLLFRGPADVVYPAMCARAAQLLAAGHAVGLLLKDDELAHFEGLPAPAALLGHDAVSMARSLFAGIRQLDGLGLDAILARMPDEADGLGLAVSDRLLRAAEGRIIEVPARR